MANKENITKKFILEALKKNLRLDGRKIADSRDINIKFG
jgi:exosome complex RNA-binding protein Rrp42 (RNase PH superfamily)